MVLISFGIIVPKKIIKSQSWAIGSVTKAQIDRAHAAPFDHVLMEVA